MSAIPPNCDSYFIFHGTGTSSALPLLPCITSADNVKDIECGTCRACVDEDEEEGWKNVRGNTGGIWRKRGKDGIWKNIIIDVGKTFRQNALRIFMDHRIRSVDAVILTHGHADAIAGLDDLRAFNAPLTPNGPKPPPLPIYLSAQTLNAISAQYPYLVDKNKATGGGDVPSLDWRVWGDEWDDEEVDEIGDMTEEVKERGFVVCGVKVLPLKFHHGKYFTPPDKARPLDVPATRGSNTPIPASTTPRAEADSITAPMTSVEETVTVLTKLTGLTGLLKTTALNGNKAKPEQTPFWCYGFLFDQRTLYISDTSFVPSKTWDKLYRAVRSANNATTATTTSIETSPSSPTKSQPPLLPFPIDSPDLPLNSIDTLILDCLRVTEHSSHLSYIQALALSMKVKANKTLLVGFTHPDRHVLWEHVGRVIRGESDASSGTDDEGLRREKEEFRARIEKSGKDQGLEGVWKEALGWKGSFEPAFDGQVVKG